ncbi:MAG: hypothetical protein ABJB86_04135 [Bacteroidota bacterium]
MKLLFFLVALCLVLLRAYFSFTNHGTHNDDNDGTMTIGIGDYYAQIKWSGKVIFSDDENSIVSIPPGGYLKFRENDAKLTAESNLQGEIHYTLYDGGQDLPLNDSGNHFISACIKKMIGWGYNANGRAERIYKKGGYHALIAELPNLKMENIKAPYLNLLFSSDSLTDEELLAVIRQTENSVSDIDKENFLKRVTPARRKDSLIMIAWLEIVSHLNADIQKTNLLAGLIAQDSLSNNSFDKVIKVISQLNADIDKVKMLSQLIDKGPTDEYRLNNILEINSHFNADIDKQNIFSKLIDRKDITEDQWISMIDAAAEQQSDMDKSDLLIRIAQKMSRTERTKAAYLAAAKKINNDADYGRAVKIIN